VNRTLSDPIAAGGAGGRRRRRLVRRTRRRAALASLATVAVAVALLVPAATHQDQSVAAAGEAGSAGSPGETALAPSSSRGAGAGSNVSTTIADIQAFWATTLPEVYGTDYRPIPDDRLFPYSEQSPPPACGGSGTTPYEEVKDNAFYCSEGDFVAWDEQDLFPKLRQRFGDFAVALVLAHEWGHAIQARTNTSFDATVYMEQQADCFAGSWTHHADHGDGSLSVSPHDLDQALAGYLALRDPVGTSGGEQGAHGNAFDRVRAFQDGYDGGVRACADYESNPPPVTEESFTSQDDYDNGGNLPVSELEPLLHKDLDAYWSKTVPGFKPVADLVATSAGGSDACSGGSDHGVLSESVTYCPSTRTVHYDPATLDRAERDIGDFSAGMMLAAEWSSAVLDAGGQRLGTEAARERADCLTGAWTGSVARGERTHTDLSLSPGDLDEAVRTFVTSEDGHTGEAGSAGSPEETALAPSTKSDGGSAFVRVDAFRTGFLDGPDHCDRAAVTNT
jgi:predicted metalloprotease